LVEDVKFKVDIIRTDGSSGDNEGSGLCSLNVKAKQNAPYIQDTQRKQSDLNRECKLNGCPEGIVAYGIVADITCSVEYWIDGLMDVLWGILDIEQPGTDFTDNESGDVMRNIPGHLSDDLTMNNIKGKCDESEDDSSVDAKSNVDMKEGKCDESENDSIVDAKSNIDMKECVQHQDDHNIESGCRENSKLDMNGKHFEGKAVHFSGKTSSAMHVPDLRSLNGDSEKQQMPVVTCNSMAPQVPQVVGDTTSGTPTKASRSSVSNSDDFNEKGKQSVVQQRGRFKVTSENIALEKVIDLIHG
ncbi:hypothetical protein GIB67_015471, partial [Kingdonia uniflora]